MPNMQAPIRWDDASLSLEQPDHDPRIQEFLQCVRHNITTGYSSPTTDETKDFVPLKQIEKFLAEHDYRKLNNILAALFPGPVPPVDAVHITRDYLRVICILLRIGKGRYIHQFTSYDRLSDRNLPFDPDDRCRKFPQASDDFYLRFCTEQWKFCVPVLQYNVTDLRLESDTILPIIHKQKLNADTASGSAVLHQITLHAAYDELRRPGSPKPSSAERYAHTFVLKTYMSNDAETYYNTEVGAFRALKAFNRPNTNIIGFYGSYIHGNTFNVILEFADRGDLARYFKETPPPSSGREIISMWSSLFEVIPALASIHDVEPVESEGPRIFQGWHQDIKPQNLLVMSDGKRSAYERTIKLADLGISHFSRKSGSYRDGTARDTQGTRTYGAPECHRSSDNIERYGLRVSPKVDIWSLGCVFSEAAVWIVLGTDGIEEYRQRRRKATEHVSPQFNGGDCFHDGEKVLDIVLQMHRHVQGRLRGADYITGKVLESMVVEMLWPSAPRPNTDQLQAKAQKIVKEANDLLTGLSQETPFGGAGTANSKIDVLEGVPREPSNVPPPPWGGATIAQQPSRPPPNQPATWNAPSTSRPLSGITSPQRMSAGPRGTPDGSRFERKPSLNSGTARASPYRSPHQTFFVDEIYDPSVSYAGMEEIDECDDEQPTMLEDRRRKLNSGPLRTETAKVATSQTGSPPRWQLSNEGKERSTSDSFSDDSVLHQTGQQDGVTTPTPLQLELKRPSAPPHALVIQDKPQLSFAKALRYKNDKKARRTTAQEGLPFYWLLDRVKERDHAFLVDNSASMEPHWDDLTELFGVLAWLIKDADPDGMEVYSTISGRPVKAKDTTPLLAALKSMSQAGVTDINLSLGRILDDYKLRLHGQRTNHRSFWKSPRANFKVVRPMTLHVLTDGRWEHHADAATPIRGLVQKLGEHGLQRKQFGIQFISFGNDLNGLGRLKTLDDDLGLDLDIVDTEPFNGNLWKMLLGAINEVFDDE